jgi:predicted ATP-grasp superfamily ATP-dependent carboligase
VNEAGDAYFQRFVPGRACSAAFVACQGTAHLLGATQQLSGDSSFGATGYRYCGSIGPLRLTERFSQQWQRVGNRLAASFGLKGLFGVDAIISDEHVVPIEINPRYTASIEVLEASQAWSSIELHFSSCVGETKIIKPRAPSRYTGKAIVLARQKSIVTDELMDWIDQQNDSDDGPCVADIPVVNTSIAAGHPVVTVLAHSHSIDGVRPRLRQRAEGVLAKLESAST